MAHELYNTEWSEELGAGIVIGNFATGVAAAVRQLIEPGHYAQFRAAAAATRNDAVYEIPVILERILREHGTQPALVPAPLALAASGALAV